MTNQTQNRCLHVACLALCLLALYFTGGTVGTKSAIAATVAGFGLFGNAYGIMRLTAWLR